MPKQSPIYIKILGTGIYERIKAVDYELIGLPADTFHKITLMDGTVCYYNTFGVRSLSIADAPEKLD
jgi:hypothetical protein